MKGDPRFHEELRRLGELHDKKQEDYGKEGDPFANVRSSAAFGVEPWRGALIRMGDKITRLQQYAATGSLSNESFEDSLDDLAVYAIICKLLHREWLAQQGVTFSTTEADSRRLLGGKPLCEGCENAPYETNLNDPEVYRARCVKHHG